MRAKLLCLCIDTYTSYIQIIKYMLSYKSMYILNEIQNIKFNVPTQRYITSIHKYIQHGLQ